MIFYYIRHGNPVYNPDQLTPLGKRQAEAVGKYLAGLNINKIFSSTANRAIETATPLSELIGKDIELLEFAHEKLAGKNFIVKDEDGVDKWICVVDKIRKHLIQPAVKTDFNWYNLKEFEGYSFKEGIERVNRETDAFFEKLGYRHNREGGCYEAVNPTEESIAFFAHAGFGQAFMSSVLDIPYPQIACQFDMLHTGVTIIDFKTKNGICVPCVRNYSGTGHLYRENIPVT